MRQSKLFTKTRKEDPKDEESRNARLLIRAGFIHKEMAGAYDYLPLGLRVLEKIKNIIREEMNAIGGQEVLLTTLQNKEVWEPTNQWDDNQVDAWFKTKLKNDTELGLALTHEAPITNLARDHISSYRDVPKYLYQFQNKFRNETRAKSGIMRTREFIMKDLYSFSRDENEHKLFYDVVKQSYENIFSRIEIGEKTHLTFASGGMFSKFSHEFQTETEAGEDTIYFNREKNLAINKEVFTTDTKEDLGVQGDFVEMKAVEVGNIFTLGTRFSDALGLSYLDENGLKRPVFMGSYGIGLGRLMGIVVECLSDDKGIVWPREISPFEAHIISLSQDQKVIDTAEYLYKKLKLKDNILYDDRDLRVGEKLNDADLLGIHTQIIVGNKSLENGTVEVKDRKTWEVKNVTVDEIRLEMLG